MSLLIRTRSGKQFGVYTSRRWTGYILGQSLTIIAPAHYSQPSSYAELEDQEPAVRWLHGVVDLYLPFEKVFHEAICTLAADIW
jgi:hypothetical protein